MQRPHKKNVQYSISKGVKKGENGKNRRARTTEVMSMEFSYLASFMI